MVMATLVSQKKPTAVPNQTIEDVAEEVLNFAFCQYEPTASAAERLKKKRGILRTPKLFQRSQSTSSVSTVAHHNGDMLHTIQSSASATTAGGGGNKKNVRWSDKVQEAYQVQQQPSTEMSCNLMDNVVESCAEVGLVQLPPDYPGGRGTDNSVSVKDGEEFERQKKAKRESKNKVSSKGTSIKAKTKYDTIQEIVEQQQEHDHEYAKNDDMTKSRKHTRIMVVPPPPPPPPPPPLPSVGKMCGVPIDCGKIEDALETDIHAMEADHEDHRKHKNREEDYNDEDYDDDNNSLVDDGDDDDDDDDHDDDSSSKSDESLDHNDRKKKGDDSLNGRKDRRSSKPKMKSSKVIIASSSSSSSEGAGTDWDASSSANATGRSWPKFRGRTPSRSDSDSDSGNKKGSDKTRPSTMFHKYEAASNSQVDAVESVRSGIKPTSRSLFNKGRYGDADWDDSVLPLGSTEDELTADGVGKVSSRTRWSFSGRGTSGSSALRSIKNKIIGRTSSPGPLRRGRSRSSERRLSLDGKTQERSRSLSPGNAAPQNFPKIHPAHPLSQTPQKRQDRDDLLERQSYITAYREAAEIDTMDTDDKLERQSFITAFRQSTGDVISQTGTMQYDDGVERESMITANRQGLDVGSLPTRPMQRMSCPPEFDRQSFITEYRQNAESNESLQKRARGRSPSRSLDRHSVGPVASGKKSLSPFRTSNCRRSTSPFRRNEQSRRQASLERSSSHQRNNPQSNTLLQAMPMQPTTMPMMDPRFVYGAHPVGTQGYAAGYGPANMSGQMHPPHPCSISAPDSQRTKSELVSLQPSLPKEQPVPPAPESYMPVVKGQQLLETASLENAEHMKESEITWEERTRLAWERLRNGFSVAEETKQSAGQESAQDRIEAEDSTPSVPAMQDHNAKQSPSTTGPSPSSAQPREPMLQVQIQQNPSEHHPSEHPQMQQEAPSLQLERNTTSTSKSPVGILRNSSSGSEKRVSFGQPSEQIYNDTQDENVLHVVTGKKKKVFRGRKLIAGMFGGGGGGGGGGGAKKSSAPKLAIPSSRSIDMTVTNSTSASWDDGYMMIDPAHMHMQQHYYQQPYPFYPGYPYMYPTPPGSSQPFAPLTPYHQPHQPVIDPKNYPQIPFPPNATYFPVPPNAVVRPPMPGFYNPYIMHDNKGVDQSSTLREA